MENIKNKLKKWNSVFCRGMVCKTNVKRDFFVILVAVLFAAALLFENGSIGSKNVSDSASLSEISAGNGVVQNVSEEEISSEVAANVEKIDTSNWRSFQNQFYGFKIKYPSDWTTPKGQSAPSSSKWEYRYQFRKNASENNLYLGFDVVMYSVAKVKELSGTEEFPVVKSEELKQESRCQNIEGHSIDTGDYPVAEIYIPATDDCYESTLFFSLIKEQYIYNIIPVREEDVTQEGDMRILVNDDFPELYSVASTFELIDIVRPKPKPPAPPKPKITAPKPVSYKVVGGRLVCAKKNDKPRKSRQNKGKHLDMECCLDPDEYPNPWCTY